MNPTAIAKSTTATAPRRRRAAGGVIAEAPLILVDGALCRLRVWTEAEWAALPEAERPAHRTYAAGLGWVAAVPALSVHGGD